MLGYFSAANDYYTEVDGTCNNTAIVDLWDTDKPATRVNGTGPDNYKDALFAERLIQVVEDHDPNAPLLVPDRYAQKLSFVDDSRHQHVHTMIDYLDEVIGNLINSLKNCDILSLVVTMVDH